MKNVEKEDRLGVDVRLIRVMIGAPGDLKQEVDIIRQEILEWNTQHAEEKKVVLVAKHWTTDANPKLGNSGQQTINKQLVEKSDLLFAMFWNRLGTPTGNAPSGTAEEINEFYQAGKTVKVYFSSLAIDRSIMISAKSREEIDRLESFKGDVRKVGLYDEYHSWEEFRTKIKRHLHLEVISIISEDFKIVSRKPMLTTTLNLDDFSGINLSNWEIRAKDIAYWIILDAIKESENRISFRVVDIIKIYQSVLHKLGITIYRVNSGALITDLMIDCIDHKILDNRGLKHRASLTSSYLYSKLASGALTRITNNKRGREGETYYGFSIKQGATNQYEKCMNELFRIGIQPETFEKIPHLCEGGVEIALFLPGDILSSVEAMNPKEFAKQLALR